MGLLDSAHPNHLIDAAMCITAVQSRDVCPVAVLVIGFA